MSLGNCVLAYNKTIELLNLDIPKGVARIHVRGQDWDRVELADLRGDKSAWEVLYSPDSTTTVMYLYERYFQTDRLYDEFYQYINSLSDSDYITLTYSHGVFDFHVLVYKDTEAGRIRFVNATTKEELFSVRESAVVLRKTFLSRLAKGLRPFYFKVFHLVGVTVGTKKKLALSRLYGHFTSNDVKYYISRLRWSDTESSVVITSDFIKYYKKDLIIEEGDLTLPFRGKNYNIEKMLYEEYDIFSFKNPLYMSKTTDGVESGLVMDIIKDATGKETHAVIHNNMNGEISFGRGRKAQKFRKLKLRKDKKGVHVLINSKRVPIEI